MGYAYGVFHWAVHFLLAFVLAILLDLNRSGYLLVFSATVFVDLDHVPAMLRDGIKNILSFDKAMKFPLHNLYFLGFCFVLSIILLIDSFLFLGSVFAAVALHMVWDLAEDMIIFKMGMNHWK